MVGTVAVGLAAVVDFVVAVAVMEVDPHLAGMVAAPVVVHTKIDRSAAAGMKQAAADIDQEAAVVEDRHHLVELDTALAGEDDHSVAAGSARASELVVGLDRLADQVVDHAAFAAHFAVVKEVVDPVALVVRCDAVAGRMDQED